MNDLVTTCVFERERERERERDFTRMKKKIKRTFLIVIRKKEENKI